MMVGERGGGKRREENCKRGGGGGRERERERESGAGGGGERMQIKRQTERNVTTKLDLL